MAARNKCLPKVPWETWARDAGLPNGDKEWENWKYFEKWAQTLLNSCVGGGIGASVYAAAFNGILIGGVRTPRYYAPGVDITLDGYTTSLVTAGTSTTTLRILRGTGTGAPSAIKTFSLLSGTAYQTDTGGQTIADGQYFQVEIQTAGTAANTLLCQVAISEVP